MRFYLETYGCTMNHGESAELCRSLTDAGHQRISDEEQAEVVLINTCTVIAPTEKKVLRRLHHFQELGKDLMIVGCMASVYEERLAEEFPGALICGTDDYSNFLSVLKKDYGVTASSGTDHVPSVQMILPIAQGCNGACTYCMTKLARGELRSVPMKDLVERCERTVSRGTKEILITSQDTAAYGMDRDERLPELLKTIAALPGDFRIRIGMMNPDNLKEILEGMLEVFQSPKVYRFLHLPVQSGSDRIIRDMGRAYTANDYLELVGKLREAVPDLMLATDAIAGFPGETVEDHHMTLALMERLRPDIINVTRFSARPGTAAAVMKEQVQGWVSNERSRELTALRFRISSEINAAKVGQVVQVLIDEKGKGKSVIARTDQYLPVVIQGEHLLWQRVTVKITASARTHLYGTIVPDMEN